MLAETTSSQGVQRRPKCTLRGVSVRRASLASADIEIAMAEADIDAEVARALAEADVEGTVAEAMESLEDLDIDVEIDADET